MHEIAFTIHYIMYIFLQSIKGKLKEANEHYIIKILKAEIIAINVNGN